MDSYIVIIVATFVGFMALAAALLVPVYRFLNKEEVIASQWTDETVAKRGIHVPGSTGPNLQDVSSENDDEASVRDRQKEGL